MSDACGVSYTDEALEIVPALNRAELALRIEATDTSDGLERLRLRALADAVAAERRIQQQKRDPRTPAEIEAARRRPRRPRMTSTESPAA